MAGCSAKPTQPAVVFRPEALSCDPQARSQDPYESATARARCDHPDMLIHPRLYVVRRVPSTPGTTRFTLDQPAAGTSECCYEVDRTGAATFRPR